MFIGERILKLRKEAKLSQEDVANKLNVSRQTISKWETGESTPDFDKILPLCELFNITTDELIKGVKSEEEKNMNNNYSKAKTAKVVASCVFLYFIAIIWVIVGSTIEKLNDEIMVSIFLLICAIPTCMLIYHFISRGHQEKINVQKKKYKKVDEIISLIFTIAYLVISFATKRWDVTWILWIIYSLVIEITHLILEQKEAKKDE